MPVASPDIASVLGCIVPSLWLSIATPVQHRNAVVQLSYRALLDRVDEFSFVLSVAAHLMSRQLASKVLAVSEACSFAIARRLASKMSSMIFLRTPWVRSWMTWAIPATDSVLCFPV